MHWILQTNLFNEKEWDNLVSTLERFDLPYSIHKVVPFVGELIPPAEPKQEKVICFGSYSMRHTAKANNWNPGVYDLFDQNFLVQKEHWGEMMLNYDSEVKTFEDVGIIYEPTFMRPIDDSKYFAGKVFDPEDFNQWYRNVVVLEHDYGDSLTKNTLVQICKPKKIYAEYRYWIVDGNIVSRSLYKRGTIVTYSDQVDAHIDQFVSRVLHHGNIQLGMGSRGWLPHKAFVLDVCETPEGMRIVEINTINSAGLYAGNVTEIVMALEHMEKHG